ncbi:MAG: cyclic nucleotide-binding domain-containing protein [Acidobacteriota bacterium]
MDFSGSFAAYLVVLGALAAAILPLQAITRNGFIRGKLRFSLLVIAAAAAYEIASNYYQLQTDHPSAIGKLLVAFAFINAIAALLFNPFKQEKISDRYPRIVQDAVVVGAFVLIATSVAPNQLFATSAIGGLVLGLALQDTLGNLFAGLAIQVEKPFAVGDWIKAGDYEGRVAEVTWRATKMRTKSGQFVVIPNSLVSKDIVVNYSNPSPVQRMNFSIGLPYEVPPNLAKRIALETCEEIPSILKEPAPDVLLREYGESSINYSCRFWIDDFSRNDPIIDEFATLLYYRLKRAGISMPFPIRDIRITQPVAQDLTADDGSRLAFVEKAGLFRNLEMADKQAIAKVMHPVTFAAGETIIRQADAGDSMFFVKSGSVKVILESGGERHEVTRLTEGDFFGEMALLTGEPRTATVVAACDVEAFVLSKEPFREVLQQNPAIAEKISQTMTLRKAMLEQQASQISTLTVRIQTEEQRNFLVRIQRFFGLG